MPEESTLFIAGILLLGGAVLVVALLLDRKRTQGMMAVAQRLGLGFFPKASTDVLPSPRQLPLLSQGHARRVKNLMQGEAQGKAVSIFDYQYTRGYGKNSHTYRQTVAMFRSPEMSLPGFALRPEGFFHKLGSAFGYQDIDFERHPVFSGRYLLKGDPEDAVRAVFDEPVLAYYEARPGLSTEGEGDCLIYYRASKKVAPERIEDFLGEGFEVFGLFSRSAAERHA